MDPESSPDEPTLESDPRFPSGPWVGFFLDPKRLPGRQWMELHLKFSRGRLHGEGRDYVGTFLMAGGYDLSSGKCWWAKRYLGEHDVAYDGYNEGRGIWGTWSLTGTAYHGGFHIWPVGMADPTRPAFAEEAEIPAAEMIPAVEECVAEPAGAAS